MFFKMSKKVERGRKKCVLSNVNDLTMAVWCACFGTIFLLTCYSMILICEHLLHFRVQYSWIPSFSDSVILGFHYSRSSKP